MMQLCMPTHNNTLNGMDDAVPALPQQHTSQYPIASVATEHVAHPPIPLGPVDPKCFQPNYSQMTVDDSLDPLSAMTH